MYSSLRLIRTAVAQGGNAAPSSTQGPASLELSAEAGIDVKPMTATTSAARAVTALAERPRRARSTIRKPDLVITNPEEVSLGDRFSRDALAVVLDAVRRAHVDHVELAVQVLDHRVLTRDVR